MKETNIEDYPGYVVYVISTMKCVMQQMQVVFLCVVIPSFFLCSFKGPSVHVINFAQIFLSLAGLYYGM